MTMKFQLGQIVVTARVHERSEQDKKFAEFVTRCIVRHSIGDWGCVCAEDKKENDSALALGNRLLSAYAIDESKPSKGYGENTLWVITEWDRSVTTVLFPDEY